MLVKVAALPEAEYGETDRRAMVCCLRVEERPPCGTECNEGYYRDEGVAISNKGDLAPLKPSYACTR